MIINKGKQNEDEIQNEKVFLYKLYDISSKSSNLKNPELTFIQDKINNLEKYMKFLQALVKTIPFHLSPHYKSLQPNREQNEQYWKEVAVKFLKQKHNIDITR